jgi:DNA-binding IclR family transcriptional regulator
MTLSIAEPDRDNRASIDKAISLLVALGDHSGTGAGVSELARRAQLTKSTAFRLLGMLERNGVVERTGTGYLLGARLHTLGRAVYSPNHDQLRDLLVPFLADLYESTHHTVHLAALHSTDVIYLAKLYGHRTVVAPSRIGGRLPAHWTAVGKALLAYSAGTAAKILAAPLDAATPHTITDPSKLSGELAWIRQHGIAYDGQESRLGVSCIAVPILDGRGRAVAAMSIAGQHGTLDPRKLEGILRQICSSASRALTRSQLARTA